MTNPTNETVLVADHDLEVRTFLETALSSHGFAVQHAEDCEELLECLGGREDKAVSAVVLDTMTPGRGGLDVWRVIRSRQRHLPVVLLWSPWSSSGPAEAADDGRTHCLQKPVSHAELSQALRRFLGERPQANRFLEVQTPYHTARAEPENPRMRHIEFALERLARSEVPVLLQGETGVGKEVLARRIHACSRRAARPFVKVNCAALPTELVESELFGYERGAFTGANRSQAGLFEVADGGTLLLDEIGDMEFALQAKLLQVLQDGEFHRLGSSMSVRVNVRVMAATHSDLLVAVREGHFREDLYYRLNVVQIRVPPLRERKDEIPGLSRLFLVKHGGGPVPEELPRELREAMLQYHWPGNIRELENLIRRFLVLRNPTILVEEMRRATYRAGLEMVTLQPQAGPESLLEKVNEVTRTAEIAAIRSALQATRWSRKQAAALLNLDYKALLYKMKKFHIAPVDLRGSKVRDVAEVSGL